MSVCSWFVIIFKFDIWIKVDQLDDTSKCHLVGQPLFKYQDDARSNTHKILSLIFINRHEKRRVEWFVVWHALFNPRIRVTVDMLHSSMEYHQEHATDPYSVHKDVPDVCSAVIYVSTEFPLSTKY